MIQEKYKTIIDNLISATQSDKIQWGKTSRDSEYIVNVGQGSVTIDYSSNNDPFSSSFYEAVNFSIRNDIGEPIIRIYVQDEDAEYKYLKDFYDLVNNSYLKADKTINSMMDFLNNLK
ncbi:hypothetical protein CLV62_12453 [Dysgonomonas alginatilytica]|uniref:Uncharacterized protein n=1 Tax=Dysgonomonas alginatilytica TaxID=1605892 RepID=A0A2V3PK76_9BACT|nr:hypothetical protein [Dysgonomonas alginatilytica]PXV61898.1 hypothetical protein CLV62_12453 [Dysgonomonas alginatilytica]